MILSGMPSRIAFEIEDLRTQTGVLPHRVITALPFPDLLPIHGQVPRCVHSDPDLSALNIQDRNANITTDDD
jgi:hypothetical protein